VLIIDKGQNWLKVMQLICWILLKPLLMQTLDNAFAMQQLQEVWKDKLQEQRNQHLLLKLNSNGDSGTAWTWLRCKFNCCHCNPVTLWKIIFTSNIRQPTCSHLFKLNSIKYFADQEPFLRSEPSAALILIIQFGLKVDGKSYADFLMKDVGGTMEIDGNIINGYLICYIMLQLLLVHVPCISGTDCC
jgi:hypothetical protein